MWNAMYSIHTCHFGAHTFPFWLYRLRCSLTLPPAVCKCFTVIFCWKHYRFLWRWIFLDKVILLCSIFVFWHRRIVVSSKNTSHTEKMINFCPHNSESKAKHCLWRTGLWYPNIPSPPLSLQHLVQQWYTLFFFVVQGHLVFVSYIFYLSYIFYVKDYLNSHYKRRLILALFRKRERSVTFALQFPDCQKMAF